MKGDTMAGRRLASGLMRLRKVWEWVKAWILLYGYLLDDKCVDCVRLPMGWIRKCRHHFITYYKIVPKEVRG